MTVTHTASSRTACTGSSPASARRCPVPHRLEILELLARASARSIRSATEIGLSLANTSQHLQALRQAALVESRKDGLFVYYRLAGPGGLRLSHGDPNRRRTPTRGARAARPGAFRRPVGRRSRGDGGTAEASAIEAGRRCSTPGPRASTSPATSPARFRCRSTSSKRRLRQLPKGKEYVAYCRGPYCVYADRAVEMLRANGRRARRLLEGFPEWRAAGFPVAVAASGACAACCERGMSAARVRPR